MSTPNHPLTPALSLKEGVVKAWIGFLGKTKKCRVRRMGATHQIKARRHITTVTKPD